MILHKKNRRINKHFWRFGYIYFQTSYILILLTIPKRSFSENKKQYFNISLGENIVIQFVFNQINLPINKLACHVGIVNCVSKNFGMKEIIPDTKNICKQLPRIEKVKHPFLNRRSTVLINPTINTETFQISFK